MTNASKTVLSALKSVAPEYDWPSIITSTEHGRDVLRQIETAASLNGDDDDATREDIETIVANQPTAKVKPAPQPEPQADEPAKEEPMTQSAANVSPGNFDLAEYIVDTATANRDRILEGLELGGTTNITHTFQIPNTPEVTIERAHAKLPLLVKAAGLRRPIMLVGPAGSGKTTAGRQLAEAYGVEFYANSNSPMDTRSAAFGYMDGSGTYHPGYLYKAMKEGGVLLDDEVDASNPAVMVSKNAAIENRFAFFPNGERVDAHENFIYIGSANTYGRGADRVYVGRTPLDGSTINRFIFIDWEYDEELERQLACNHEWVDFVQAVRQQVFEHEMRYVVSPRQSIVGSELLALGLPEEEVRNMTVFPGWPQADVDRVLRAIA